MARVTIVLTDHPVTEKVMIALEAAPDIDTEKTLTAAQTMAFDILTVLRDRHNLSDIRNLLPDGTEEQLELVDTAPPG